MSFYQRKLPVETCVAFASREGKNIFRSALEHGGLKSFYNVIEQHHTQTEPAFCGVSTLVLVLNALAVDPGQHWKGPWRWYEERMLNCCLDLEEIKNSGITLRDFQCLALCQGLTVDLQYCDDKTSLDDFRRAVEAACVEREGETDEVADLQVLVVSYNRKILKQTGSGHFSPVAAYDKDSDSILILDTARFKYGAHWVKLPLMYEAMRPIDPDSGKSRGFILLSFLPPEPREQEESSSNNSEPCKSLSLMDASVSPTQPASILFRSKMRANDERRKFKEYMEAIDNEKITFEKIRSYWTKDGHPTAIWNIIEPIRSNDDEEKKMIHRMRLLIADLRTDIGTDSAADENKSSCCQNDKHNHCVTVDEALVIICLASVSEKVRRDIVMNAKSKQDTLVREELLKEASLIASAIVMSDEFESFQN
jgi:glutathione gamma-glutamylcysteinyltransferase